MPIEEQARSLVDRTVLTHNAPNRDTHKSFIGSFMGNSQTYFTFSDVGIITAKTGGK